MATIQSLLNPLSAIEQHSRQLPSPNSTVYTDDFSPQLHIRKKQKVSKDVAIFTRGNIRGDCRYPPYDFQDGTLATHHQQYEINPTGNIADFPRHIPYSSEKKSFLDKTGRESFEVFQYQFKIPGDEKVHYMMWDYNIGLVRTTPLFKCNGYSKTTPAKMLNRNPGLRDICHSITGGALAAQGYWMPFEAAKAVAATFCWNIRYALTPIFGPDFPSQCIPPDSDRFGEMVIDAEVTRRCTEEARAYRSMETRASSRASSIMRSPATPDSPSYPRHIKHLRPKDLEPSQTCSDYSTDDGPGQNYTLASAASNLSYRNTWTPANTPRSAARLDLRLCSPQDILAGICSVASDRALESPSPASSPPPPRRTNQAYSPEDDYDGDYSDGYSCDDAGPRYQRSKTHASPSPSDEKAAYLLMSLRMKKADLNHESRGKKRRAST